MLTFHYSDHGNIFKVVRYVLKFHKNIIANNFSELIYNKCFIPSSKFRIVIHLEPSQAFLFQKGTLYSLTLSRQHPPKMLSKAFLCVRSTKIHFVNATNVAAMITTYLKNSTNTPKCGLNKRNAVAAKTRHEKLFKSQVLNA